jgi:hypothetical protein
LPPSMPSSVYFSVKDEPPNKRSKDFEVTHAPRVLPPPQTLGQKHSAQGHGVGDLDFAVPGASSDGTHRQRSIALSVQSSTTCTPSYTARGPLESITRSPSWVAMDSSPVDTAPGQPLPPPEGPFFSSPQEAPDHHGTHQLALAAQPRSPYTGDGASLDTLPPNND